MLDNFFLGANEIDNTLGKVDLHCPFFPSSKNFFMVSKNKSNFLLFFNYFFRKNAIHCFDIHLQSNLWLKIF